MTIRTQILLAAATAVTLAWSLTAIQFVASHGASF
jgi:hypothetical protein